MPRGQQKRGRKGGQSSRKDKSKSSGKQSMNPIENLFGKDKY